MYSLDSGFFLSMLHLCTALWLVIGQRLCSKRPELVRPPLFLKDLCVGWGARPWFRQVPCLPVPALSSVHACSPTISAGHEDSLLSPGHVGGRQPGLFAEFKLLCGSLTFRISLFLFWFCCWLVDWTNRDGFLRLANDDLLNSIFSRWAPVQLSLSGHEAVSVCGPRRAPTLTTGEGRQ